ncbi:hypothetical protein [Kibdelosporangium phytohabitans]|uniref:Uncharacterized protein n=1 Tax=Kibdelosporangium phytohabitans TaxID=860235 RepID=A0A0N7F4Y8_9PSEU|nr:hypothetical protein [Kibdelosporangium phytohabitans]ALG12751.1 hypothetical protein AOZ06_43125 [Kibdelosporangium phytohabitans]MBE1464425.1 hypothetical protein [Kibdelosporangium phytohabitans]
MTDISRPPARRSPVRLVSGLLWLVAAGLGIGSTFPVVFTRYFQSGFRIDTAYWQTRTEGLNDEPIVGTTYLGVPVVLAAVVLVGACLVALLSTRRWGAIVAGTFGTGILVDSALTWWFGMATPESEDDQSRIEVGTGLVLITVATVVALAALVLALAERARPQYAPAPYYQPPHQPTHPPMRPVQMPPHMAQQSAQQPPPQPQPQRWEPETPSYGVPVQTEAPQEPDTPAPIEPPPAPEPGTISRKLDGEDK